MDTSEIVLLVSLILGFDIVIVIVILRVRAKKRRAGGALQRVADEEGWVAMTRDGGIDYAGSTASGHAWQLQSSKSGSVWRCAEVGLSDQIVALGPFRGLYEKLGGDTDVDLSHPMIRAALARMFSPARAERLATAQMVDLDSALPDGFALFTDTEDLSRRFLADPVTPLLEEWAAGSRHAPAIILDDDGLEIRFSKGLDSAEEWRQVVALGSLLALRVGEVRTSA